MISNFANSSELFVNYLVELNVYMFSFGCERCGDSKRKPEDSAQHESGVKMEFSLNVFTDKIFVKRVI